MLRATISRISVPRLGRWADFERQASHPAASASDTHSSSIRIVSRRITLEGASSRHSRMRSRAFSELCISSTRMISGCDSAMGRRTQARPSTFPITFRPAALRRASRIVSITNELSATSTIFFMTLFLPWMRCQRVRAEPRHAGLTDGEPDFFLTN